jgi:hypothetical protein
VQADETTDISSLSQFVILLRFVKGSAPVETILSFVNVEDRTADGFGFGFEERAETVQP